jgi:uncharacterized membrane protein YphA (DoxX/SURF4 family)
MKKLIFNQQPLWKDAISLLRIWTGVIFFRYGLSLLHQNSMIDFTDTLKTVDLPLPVLSAYLCKITEFFGGICLFIGFLKKPFCLLLIIDMLVATFVFHKGLVLQNGMTTFLLLICCITLFLSANDKLSIDWYISNKW